MKAVEKCYTTLVGFCWLSHVVYATIAHYPNSLGITVEDKQANNTIINIKSDEI